MVYEETETYDIDIDDSSLTSLQRRILSKRVNSVTIDKLNKYNYTIKDLYSRKFNPTRDIDLLPDIKEAAIDIAKHINENKHIILVSDFDTDGISTASVFEIAFRDIFKYKNYSALVNERLTGTGFTEALNNRILNIHKENPIDMILLGDHGSSDNSSYKLLKEAGIKTIVLTDHHHIDYNNYPEYADYVVNPQREDSEYHKDISGCFVAYLTILLTYRELYKEDKDNLLEPLLPYVALSTISDVMELNNPLNRIVVTVGLREMNKYNSPVWKVFKDQLGLSNVYNYNDLAFKISPLINTANRVNKEQIAYKLMISETYTDAVRLIKELVKYSKIKKDAHKIGTNNGMKELDNYKYKNSAVLVIDSKYAVNGIVAASIGEKIGKPTVCFINIEGDTSEVYSGSARAIVNGVDLVQVFDNINEKDNTILKGYGGHKQAAGCAVYKKKIDEFKKLFDNEVVKQIGTYKSSDVVKYDIELKPNEITPYLVKDMYRLAPYGKAWEKISFMSVLEVKNIITFSNIAKITFKISDSFNIEGMCFFNNNNMDINHTNIYDKVKYRTDSNIVKYKKLKIVYTIDISSFRNVASTSMNIMYMEVV